MSRVEPERNRYVGHRYVPKIFGEWDKKNEYEGLSIVTYQGTSYTSKKRVPVGIDISNDEYWVVTGNYNAQVEQYRQDVDRINNKVIEVDNELNDKADLIYVDNEIKDINDNLEKKVNGTIENTIIYIDPNGNDNNDGLSVNRPVKTIEHAVTLIPDVIAHDHEYTLSLGVGVWNEKIELSNKVVHGILTVKGSTENRLNHQVERAEFSNITGHLNVGNLYVNSQFGQGYRFNRCNPYVYVYNVESDSDVQTNNSGTIGLVADYGSNVHVTQSKFSNKRYGLRSNYLSRIYSTDNTGDGNFFGVGGRWGGILQTFGSQPLGRTNLTVDSSGLIIDGKGVINSVPRGDVYLANQTSSNNDNQFNTRHYEIVNINNGNREIGSNEKLSLYFDSRVGGVISITVEFGGKRITNNNTGYIKATWNGTISQSELVTGQWEMKGNRYLDLSNLSIEHLGNLKFKISITPTDAQSGWWRTDVTSKMMRYLEAPILEDVVIETIETI